VTMKQLEKRIAALEKELSELKSQMLTLSLQRPVAVIPSPVPVYPPLPQPVYIQPQITPWQSPFQPTITCESTAGRFQ
jgi:hypothetical protein